MLISPDAARADIEVLSVPYDSGHLRARMGAGPDRLLASGLRQRLQKSGRRVELRSVARQLSGLVRGARQRVAWPLILPGNCGTAAIGAIAGIGDPEIGMVWFDAHADFNTPETTASGFLDGMALAIATGCCWRSLAASIPGFRPVPQQQVVLVGARDLDPAEAKLLSQSAVTLVSDFGGGFISALDSLTARAREVYLHIDLDVIDPSNGRANSYASPGGLELSEVLRAIDAISDRFTINAAALTSYDPAEDLEGGIAEAAGQIAVALTRAATHATDTVSSNRA